MKVYVLTKTWCDDVAIVAVYASRSDAYKEMAEKPLLWNSCYAFYDVEEVEYFTEKLP